MNTLGFVAVVNLIIFFGPQAIDRALELTKVKAFSVPSPERAEQLRSATKEFDKALDSIASEGLPQNALSNSAFTVREWLKRVALDRKSKPHRYQELLDKYVTRREMEERSQTSPEIDANHLSEEYRLCWEYLLLAPLDGQAHYSERALRALGKINNPLSLTTITHFFEITCQKDVPADRVSAEQTWTLMALNQFPSEAGLQSILDCLSSAHAQKQREEKPAQFDAEETLIKTWKTWSQHNDEIAKRWQKVFRDFPRGTIDNSKAQILVRLGNAFRSD